MPTKFVVLWLQTVFITANGKPDYDNEVVPLSENCESLEDAMRLYNKKAAEDSTQQAMILVPLKQFDRAR